jgi:hypothetical protein
MINATRALTTTATGSPITIDRCNRDVMMPLANAPTPSSAP